VSRSDRQMFSVGQVVFVDEEGFYGRVVRAKLELGTWIYAVQVSPSPNVLSHWTERDLRSLSKEEAAGR
jgi:hypothetical protein